MTVANQPPKIFDLGLIQKRIVRARAMGANQFLIDRLQEDMFERLDLVQRPFSNILDIGTITPQFLERLKVKYQPDSASHIGLMDQIGIEDVANETLINQEFLNLKPQSYDLIVSVFALQVINDLPGLLVQIRQALKPDGLFLACLLGGQSLHELRSALTQAEAELKGGVSPRISPFADVRDLGLLLQRAGFTLPVADKDNLLIRYPNIHKLMQDLRSLAASNPLWIERKTNLTRSVIARSAEIYHELYSDNDNRIRASFDLIWLSGWAPHPSQQQPLKPGSAKMHLSQVLPDRSAI
mgnify:CR=1 FL=1